MNYRTIDYLMSVNDGINPYGFVHHYKKNYRMNGGTIEEIKRLENLIKDLENQGKVEDLNNLQLQIIEKSGQNKKYKNDLENLNNQIIEWKKQNQKQPGNMEMINIEEELKKIEDEEKKTEEKEEGLIITKNIMPIYREGMGKQYKSEVIYKFNNPETNEPMVYMIKGSNQPILNKIMDEFVKRGGPWGKRFEKCYVEVLSREKDEYGNTEKGIINNDENKFYKQYETTIPRPNAKEGESKFLKASECLPYDISRRERKRVDELKCYIDNTTKAELDRLEELYGFDGVLVQFSKLGNDEARYIPYFKKDKNGDIKYFDSVDTYYRNNKKYLPLAINTVLQNEFSNLYVNNNVLNTPDLKPTKFINNDLYMVYLLENGLFELKLNDEKLFFFDKVDIQSKSSVFCNKNIKIEQTGTYIFDMAKIIENANENAKNITKETPYVIDKKQVQYKTEYRLWVNKKFLTEFKNK